jgi:hypothetical protein
MDFWSFFWYAVVVFFMITYFMILINIIVDIFRSKDIGGVAKTAWILLIFFLPLITMLIYIIVRGTGMSDRSMAAAGASASAIQIAQAKQLLDSGAINASEFETLKARALKF